ncbi:MAG: hypothetical protein LYZ69_03150 [Nitrososphaerales archaeon]|nr:hypothetical protein [Nitrososphaerales archaeon]
MAVDFVVGRAPRYRVATRTLVGGWPGDRKLQAEFAKIAVWARRLGLKTGSWFFRELDGPDVPSKRRKWEVGIEVKGRKALKGEKGMSLKVLPATTAVSITFNPAEVSPELIYCGLEGWVRWRRKEGKYKQGGRYREVYRGNPWKSKRAWARTQVQVPLKRLSR